VTGARRDSAPAGGQSDVLRDLLGVLYRRRVIFIVIFAATTTAAALVSAVRPSLYESASTVIADKSPPVVLLTASGRESSLVQQPLAQAPDAFTLTELAKSETVRKSALARLTPPFDPDAMREILARGVRVQQVRSTDLVRVSVRDRDPMVAAAVANAVAESTVEQDVRARRRFATIARRFIGGQLDAAGRELRATQHALAAFKRSSRDVSLTEETQLNIRKLADLRAELSDVRRQGQYAEVAFARPLSGPRPGTGQELADPVITTLQSQLASLRVEYAGLRGQFTPLHPQVVSTQAKIEETQQRLNDEISRKRAAMSAREQGLSSDITALEHVLMQVPTQEALLARLSLDARDAERTYLLLSEKFQEARIAEGSVGSAVRVVDLAKASTAPVGPARRTTVIFGMVLAFLLGLGGAEAVEQFEHTVPSAREVERILGAPVLGVGPSLNPADLPPPPASGTPLTLLTQFAPTSRTAEECRILRTHVLQAMHRAGAKCLAITSAGPGEGKSTVVASIAIAVAQTDRQVWLLDCNLRDPALDRLFPEALSGGLSACLAGHTSLDDVVRATHQPRLGCVVSGPLVPDPTQLLDTQLMTGILDQARERADVVLLDLPAIDAVTDAEIVAVRSDAALFVVQLNKTDARALARARQRLADLGVRVLGAVVNHAAPPQPAPFREAWKAGDWRARSALILARFR
jgi:polysaccharide biosynthesis transport protein